ncbi:hypothetical protein CHU98_g1337, partial [Xylaria longipes]
VRGGGDDVVVDDAGPWGWEGEDEEMDRACEDEGDEPYDVLPGEDCSGVPSDVVRVNGSGRGSVVSVETDRFVSGSLRCKSVSTEKYDGAGASSDIDVQRRWMCKMQMQRPSTSKSVQRQQVGRASQEDNDAMQKSKAAGEDEGIAKLYPSALAALHALRCAADTLQ